MLTIQVNTPTQDKQVITTLGIATLSEGTSNLDQQLISNPAITISGLVISGLCTDVHLDLYQSETYAENLMSFLSVPDAYSTITISGITYTFIPLASGYSADHQIKLGSTPFGTASNFYKTLMTTFYDTGIESIIYAADRNFGDLETVQWSNFTLPYALDFSGGNLIAVSDESGQYFGLSNLFSPTIIGKSYRITLSVETTTINAWYVASYDGTQEYGSFGNITSTISFDFTATTTGGIRITSTDSGEVIIYAASITLLNTPHSTVHVPYVNNPSVLRAITSGTAGNDIEVSTTASGIMFTFDKLYNGGITYPNLVLNQDITWSGVGTYTFDPVSSHPLGTEYEGTVKLYYNDEQLVNSSGIAVEYPLTKAKFYGKTTLDEFVEVPNLSGIWESNGYADSSGQFYITWDSPNITYSGITYGISAPATTGTPTQITRTISTIDSVQPIEYNIFVYTGSTAPQRNWPRPVDANGTWYWAGRTTKTYAQVHVPSNTKGIWVGFGNKYTYATTVTNLNQTIPTIYI